MAYFNACGNINKSNYIQLANMYFNIFLGNKNEKRYIHFLICHCVLVKCHERNGNIHTSGVRYKLIMDSILLFFLG